MSTFKPEQKYVDLINQWKRIDNFIINNQTLFCTKINSTELRFEVLHPKILISGAVDFAIWKKQDYGGDSLPVLISKDMNYCSTYLEYYGDNIPSMGYSPKESFIKFIDIDKEEVKHDISKVLTFDLESKSEEELFQLSTIHSEKELTDFWLMYKICTEFDNEYFRSFTGYQEELDIIDEELLKIAICNGVPYA